MLPEIHLLRYVLELWQCGSVTSLPKLSFLYGWKTTFICFYVLFYFKRYIFNLIFQILLSYLCLGHWLLHSRTLRVYTFQGVGRHFSWEEFKVGHHQFGELPSHCNNGNKHHIAQRYIFWGPLIHQFLFAVMCYPLQIKSIDWMINF